MSSTFNPDPCGLQRALSRRSSRTAASSSRKLPHQGIHGLEQGGRVLAVNPFPDTFKLALHPAPDCAFSSCRDRRSLSRASVASQRRT